MKKISNLQKKQIPLVVGNWKMNPSTLEKADALFSACKKAIGNKKGATVVSIAAPTIFIGSLKKLLKSSRVSLGAQDTFYEQAGSFTGMTALSMLKSLSVTHVIVGHSERRAHGETNEEVAKKAQAVLASGLEAIVCIGEKNRDTHGDYFGIIETQLKTVISAVPKSHVGRLVIAYEPVWAIGTGKHATSEDVQEMKLFIQKILADHFGRNLVNKMRILYGGSVTSENAAELLETGKADGFLVGGSSLKPSEFAAIIGISDAYAKA